MTPPTPSPQRGKGQQDIRLKTKQNTTDKTSVISQMGLNSFYFPFLTNIRRLCDSSPLNTILCLVFILTYQNYTNQILSLVFCQYKELGNKLHLTLSVRTLTEEQVTEGKLHRLFHNKKKMHWTITRADKVIETKHFLGEASLSRYYPNGVTALKNK